MAQLFGAVTLLCLGLGGAGWIWAACNREQNPDGGLVLIGLGAVGAIIGAAIGLLFRRPIMGAMIGAFWLPIAAFIYAVVVYLADPIHC